MSDTKKVHTLDYILWQGFDLYLDGYKFVLVLSAQTVASLYWGYLFRDP